MYLDDRSRDGHIVVCTGNGTEHSFLRHRLGLSVECPICGQIALSVDLIADFTGARWRIRLDRRTHDRHESKRP